MEELANALMRFMMDAERCVGGFRKHLWVPATAADGTPFWYSPLLGRVASDVPAQSSGGFCCEEMGLGKDYIISLNSSII